MFPVTIITVIFYFVNFAFIYLINGCQNFTGHKDVEVLYYENFDLDNIVTPVDAAALEHLLKECGYNANKSQFLINGFKHGFSLGYKNLKML